MGLIMKFFATLICVIALIGNVFGALPSYNNFNTNDFTTTNLIAGQISIRTIPKATSWIPITGYEVWYEPFTGGDNTAGLTGALGWSPSGSGTLNFSNSVNHFGTVALTISTTAGLVYQLFNGDTVQTRPSIPPLDATVGWTNRIIWRIANTNLLRAYLVLQDGAFVQGGIEPTNCIGFAVVTTNANQIMGFTSGGAVGNFSTTNLGAIVDAQWQTNEVWSTTAGVISFNMNGGPEATLSANIPTRSLTPTMGMIRNSVSAAASTLEIDEWTLIWTRQP
jgi:hypothetical protein